MNGVDSLKRFFFKTWKIHGGSGNPPLIRTSENKNSSVHTIKTGEI